MRLISKFWIICCDSETMTTLCLNNIFDSKNEKELELVRCIQLTIGFS